MFRTRVINLAKKYVAVSKVRFQLSHLDCPRNFVDSIKTPSSVKQISSAAETLDFQAEPRPIGENPTDFHHSLNGPYRDKFLDSQQYPNRSCHGEISYGNQRNPVEFSRGQFRKNPSDSTSGFYSEKFQQNVDGIYRGNPGEEQKMNPVWRNEISDNSYREYPKEVQYNHNGYHIESSSNYQQNPTWGYSGNNGTHNQNGSYREDRRLLQQVPNGVYRENPSEAQGSLNGYYRQNVVQPQQNSNGFHTENIGEFQQNVSGSQREMVHSQNLSNVNSNGNTGESNENNQYRGTIDELDDFCKEGKMKEAVEVLDLLEKQHIDVDLPRYLQLMQACGEAKALQEAKSVHNHLMKSKIEIKVSTYNKILEMYSKCGSMSDAYELFEKMLERNLTSWDTMITWLAKNGLGEDAIDLFTRFKEAGLRPDGQMFIAIFSACSVLCDIDEGMLHFESMRKDYGIIPSMEHYVSVVEMLGSTGYLDEAMEFIENMPFEPSVDVWEALMNLCRVNGNIALGDRCAEFIELVDPSRLTDQSKAGLVPVKASDLAKEKERKKLSTQNLLEVRSRVHEYRAGDTSHPEKDKIYALLKGMSGQMREAGYVPETRFVLHDIDQEGKEEALLSHSERLAVAYGLISSPSRSPIRIIKNLRVCGDCHSALKIISKLVGRELIIRDAKRFHHFKDGLCSCRDYW